MLAVTLLSFASHAGALDLATYTPILPPYGVSKLGFAGPNASGTIVRAHRENFNAHGFDVVTFYVGDRQSCVFQPIVDAVSG